jgi:hypothetical protein
MTVAAQPAPYAAPPMCDVCEETGGIVAGFGFVFLKPRFNNNVAFSVTDTTNFPNTFSTQRSFDFDHEVTPRIWLGYVGSSGFGGRLRYWEFDHHGDAQSFTDPGAGLFSVTGPATLTATGGLTAGGFPGPGDSVVASTGIEAYTIDAELSQAIDCCDWRVDLGGGFRHAAYSQDYTLTATNAGGALIGSSDVQHRFDGVGPTIFAEARRPLGNTGLALLATGRASILYGDTKFQASDSQFGAFTDTASFRDSTTLRIGEIQLGAEWATTLDGGSNLFVQAAWEAQIWEGTGNATSATGDDLGLTGVSLSFGIAR